MSPGSGGRDNRLGTVDVDSAEGEGGSMRVLVSDQRDVFVGRAAELELLRGTLAAVRSGSSRTVLIEGPPGIW